MMEVTGENCVLDSKEADEPTIEEVIRPYRDSLETEVKRVLCMNEMDMTKARPESALGNWFADVLMEEALRAYEGDIDFALFNTGGIRFSLSKGEVTVGNIFELMPFENELVLVTLPYNEVEDLIRYLQATGGEPVSKLKADLSDATFENVLIGGQPLEERDYAVLTSDYLSNGGDNMVFFTEGHRKERLNLDLKVRDALMEHCTALGEKGMAIRSQKDGRLYHGR
jgi:2',3'-cyclic-nucleotide 2'-phosphodiesterase (5'-nucleotidase family)